MITIRKLYLGGLLTVCALLATSLYLEWFKNVIPCPLCLLQRGAFTLFGIACLLGVIAPAKRWLYLLINSFASLSALLGLVLAGRQIWLQHYPSAATNECGVSLQYMLEVLPIHQVVQKILTGSAECTNQAWVFLSFDMAEWAFLWFVACLIFTIYVLMRIKRTKK